MAAQALNNGGSSQLKDGSPVGNQNDTVTAGTSGSSRSHSPLSQLTSRITCGMSSNDDRDEEEEEDQPSQPEEQGEEEGLREEEGVGSLRRMNSRFRGRAVPRVASRLLVVGLTLTWS